MNFTALDFETANASHSSICQIGIVRVENNFIVEKYMALIRPPGNEYTVHTIRVHGIHPETTKDAPAFDTIWPNIKRYFENQLIVCHNKGFDITKLTETLSYYSLEVPAFETDCTLQIFGKGLKTCCNENNVEFNNHHDALADAEACAKLYLIAKGVRMDANKPKATFDLYLNKKIEKVDLMPDYENCDSSSLFFKKKVVFTGDLSAMNRKQAAHLAKEKGADVKTSISKMTDIVVLGNNPGPKKMEKIEMLNIHTIDEDEFLSIVEYI